MKETGRNDPCPCGSGKKYQQCCLLRAEIPAAGNRSKKLLSTAEAIQEAFEHHQAGRLLQAESIYRQILQVERDHPDALHFLGVIALQSGNYESAVGLIGRAIRANPSDPICYINLGNTLKGQGRLDAAVENYQKALLRKPDMTEAHFNLGVTLQALGRLDAAAESYHRTLSLRPDYAEAHGNLGNTLRAQGKLDSAVESINRALSLKPDNPITQSSLLYLHGYHGSLDPHEYLSLARNWERACVPAHDRQLARDRIFRRPPPVFGRLRVGYVSGDFCQHPVSYFIEQLFAHHDRARIELFAYSANGMRDAVTERLQALVEHWIPVAGIPDAAIRDRIESDGIDVLVDLSGHTQHNRLGVFARRAAPVQAHYLGYFASTGLTEMDYLIGDAILTPPETDSHFCERVWRLPRVWVSYKTIADAPEPDWRPAGDGSVWVGSFNNLGKLTPATLTLWARILHALPEGRLLLKNHDLADEGNRQRILDVMADQGVTSERIELQRDSDWEDYMAQYNRLDISLDPVGGHGGGTTTCDALWMGAPVIHALGECATSRFTATMLNAIGHPEWIARSEEEYVDKVVTLARDVGLRKALRPGQRERMAASPLCDAKGLAISLENAYFEMFERWLENQHERASWASAIS
ncbi:MAG: tetratricopeptide repeat protein [Gallionellaceae bacterium]